MAKVKYGEGDAWNQHRRDAAHLTEYTEEAWGLGLTWQVMDPAKATVEDLLQAPVLYISGSQAPSLLPQAQKLRDYVDRGGFIFAEACCSDSSRFDVAFRQLMTAVFPEPEYKLQPITPGHPIWRMQDIVRPDSPYVGRSVWASNTVAARVSSTATEDLSCYWELARPGQWSRYPPEVVHSTSPMRSPSASTFSPTPPTANRKAKSRASTRRSPSNAVTDRVGPRRHRNRQAPPRRRLQRRARCTLQSCCAPHRKAN